MKNTLKYLFFISIGLQVSILKQAQAQPQNEACAFRATENVDAEYSWYSYNILDLEYLNATILKMVNSYLTDVPDNYELRESISFEQIQTLFSEEGIYYKDGDSLTLTFFKNKMGGDEYLQVLSNPGGNEYALLFNLRTLKVIAKSEDGEIHYRNAINGKWALCIPN